MNGHVLQGAGIAVDFWKIKGLQETYVHFLTHLHGDHIVGLTSSWRRPIYCSEITGHILETRYNISHKLIHVLPLRQSILIHSPNSSDTFCVTAFDANHCPGAIMLYFEGKFGNIFHTGDFRFSHEMKDFLSRLSGKVDKLYLDNTFCNEACEFLDREHYLNEMVDIINKHPNHDIVIGVRKFGKEIMLAKLGAALNETIYVSPELFNRTQILFDTNVFDIESTAKQEEIRIKTIPMQKVTRAHINKLNEMNQTIAIIPSAIFMGLGYKPFSRDPNIFLVPYSDHSSFPELVAFVQIIQPRKIIPIVNQSRGPFATDISDRLDMSKFDRYLQGLVENCCPSLQESQITSSNKSNNLLLSDSSKCDNGEKFFTVRSNPSFQDKTNFSKNVTLKRKKSVMLKRTKKVAKGVNFTEDESLSSSSLIDDECVRTLNKSVERSSQHLQFDDDVLENPIVIDNIDYDSVEYIRSIVEGDDIRKSEKCRKTYENQNKKINFDSQKQTKQSEEIVIVEEQDADGVVITRVENVIDQTKTKRTEKVNNKSLSESQRIDEICLLAIDTFAKDNKNHIIDFEPIEIPGESSNERHRDRLTDIPSERNFEPVKSDHRNRSTNIDDEIITSQKASEDHVSNDVIITRIDNLNKKSCLGIYQIFDDNTNNAKALISENQSNSSKDDVDTFNSSASYSKSHKFGKIGKALKTRNCCSHKKSVTVKNSLFNAMINCSQIHSSRGILSVDDKTEVLLSRPRQTFTKLMSSKSEFNKLTPKRPSYKQSSLFQRIGPRQKLSTKGDTTSIDSDNTRTTIVESTLSISTRIAACERDFKDALTVLLDI